MSVWFTSDLHIKHRAVSYARRYGGWPADKSLVTEDDVAWHDAMLAENWDKTVKADDIVYVQGDLIANSRSLDAALDWVKDRPGEKRFVLGNHDPAHGMHREAHKFQKRYYEAFDTVDAFVSRRINGTKVLLSHFPYEGDGDAHEDRDTQFRLRDEGLPLLHGHVHTKQKVTYTAAGTKQIHIGLDAWDFTPVHHDEVAALVTA